MHWLVTGATGMLGQDMVERIRAEGHHVVGLDRDGLDITDADAVARAVAGIDVVVNCAAWTAVDDAETSEPAAFAVNAVGAQVVARAAAAAGARAVQISTDYVFDGHATSPYPEDGLGAPRSAYGRTKLAGEWAVLAADERHLVVRTAWLYGARGACFPRTIARLAHERGSVQVVADQVGQPTWTADVAELVVRAVVADVAGGVLHATSSGHTSWYGFAQAVVTAAGLDASVVGPTTSDAFVRPAARPPYSVLGHDRLTALGLAPIGPWEERWALAADSVLGR